MKNIIISGLAILAISGAAQAEQCTNDVTAEVKAELITHDTQQAVNNIAEYAYLTNLNTSCLVRVTGYEYSLSTTTLVTQEGAVVRLDNVVGLYQP